MNAPGTLLLAVIKSALSDYRKNRYPSGYAGMGWVSPSLDALSYFHSQNFLDACQMAEIEFSPLFRRHGIPFPSAECECEECRIDYSREALLVLPYKNQSVYRFAQGKRHTVDWRVTGWQHTIIAINPLAIEGGEEPCSATNYLQMTVGRLPATIRTWAFQERMDWYESRRHELVDKRGRESLGHVHESHAPGSGRSG